MVSDEKLNQGDRLAGEVCGQMRQFLDRGKRVSPNILYTLKVEVHTRIKTQQGFWELCCINSGIGVNPSSDQSFVAIFESKIYWEIVSDSAGMFFGKIV